MNEPLDALLASAALWRAREAGSAAGAVVPSGWPRLDALLPGGGWPLGTLVELLLPGTGIGELRLLLPALCRLAADLPSRPGQRWLAWVAPPHCPYPPALAQGGIPPGQVLLVDSATTADRLWALEQALGSGSCAAVLGWLAAVDDRWLRRLKLAAATGPALAVLFRPAACAAEASPAALRLVLEPTPAGLDLVLLKRRGHGPARLHDALSV